MGRREFRQTRSPHPRPAFKALWRLILVSPLTVAGGSCPRPPPTPVELLCEATVLDPQTFERSVAVSEPDVFDVSFVSPATAVAPHHVNVWNGNPDGSERLTATWIEVNGLPIAEPVDFVPWVTGFSRDVELLPGSANQLTVRLEGQPQHHIAVEICGNVPQRADRIVPTAPTVTLPPDAGIPPESVTVERSEVTPPERIAEHYMPVSHVYEIALQGPGPVTFLDGPATIDFEYDPQALDEEGFLEDFAVWFLDEANGQWKPVDGGVTTDSASGAVTAGTSHFSLFVLTAKPHLLWAVYAVGNEVRVKETTTRALSPGGVFQGRWSLSRHTILETSSLLSRPAIATHENSQWIAWRDGDSILAEAVWWGPGKVRTVYDGSAGTPTPPAIASYGGRLVVVWGVGDTLYLSSSEFGVEWTPPDTQTHPGSFFNTPSIASHKGELFVSYFAGLGFSPTITRIQSDLTWGLNFNTVPRSVPAILETALASDGNRLFLGFASGDQLLVTQSDTGYDGWSEPVEIAGGGSYSEAPALGVYDGSLFAFYRDDTSLRARSSPDGDDWSAAPLEVDASGAGALPAALVRSQYSAGAPTPTVTVLHDSGHPASDVLNIVFFSEGYPQTEIPDFDAVVVDAAGVFTIINPFSHNPDLINMFRIELPSREKGPDASPVVAEAVRNGILAGGVLQGGVPDFLPRYSDTALGSQYWGFWGPNHEDDGEEPFTVHPPYLVRANKEVHIFNDYAYDLVEALIPGFDRSRDVLYAIFDHIPADGGIEIAAFNPIVSEPRFARSATNVHEMGHFMTHLADSEFDYCGGGVETDCEQSPNHTVNGDLTDPGHKWAHFFVNEGRPGDSIRADPLSRPPDRYNFWDPALVNASGIFNVGLFPTLGLSDWSGSDGYIMYVPAPFCLMWHSPRSLRFCPVCTEEWTKVLHQAAGLPFSDAAYHGNYDRLFVEFDNGKDWFDYPLEGFISVNGSFVDESQLYCQIVGLNGDERCSADITSLAVAGANQLIFHDQGIFRQLRMTEIEVVNSNGAHIPLFPVTDVSGIGTASRDSGWYWSWPEDLEFEFSAHLSAP